MVEYRQNSRPCNQTCKPDAEPYKLAERAPLSSIRKFRPTFPSRTEQARPKARRPSEGNLHRQVPGKYCGRHYLCRCRTFRFRPFAGQQRMAAKFSPDRQKKRMSFIACRAHSARWLQVNHSITGRDYRRHTLRKRLFSDDKARGIFPSPQDYLSSYFAILRVKDATAPGTGKYFRIKEKLNEESGPRNQILLPSERQSGRVTLRYTFPALLPPVSSSSPGR